MASALIPCLNGRINAIFIHIKLDQVKEKNKKPRQNINVVIISTKLSCY